MPAGRTYWHLAVTPQVDPTVYHMMNEDPGDVTYSSVGGLNEQIRELREVRRDWRSPPPPLEGAAGWGKGGSRALPSLTGASQPNRR